jgi:phage tail-like protein
MGHFSDKGMGNVPRVLGLAGTKRIRRVTAAASNGGDDTLVAGGAFLGTENDTYTVTVLTGGAPPACVVGISSARGDHPREKNVTLFGTPFRLGAVGPSAKFVCAGDGVLTEADSWTVECSAGDMQDFVSVIAHGLDWMEEEIDGFEAMSDVDAIPERFLPYLASSVDYEYDRTRSAAAQRPGIKKAILAYRIRGTVPGMLRALLIDGYMAEIAEPFKRTFQMDVAGRGFAAGMMLSDAKYTPRTFEVRLLDICRDLWGIIWDQIPRGTRMFAVHEIHGRSRIPAYAIGYVTGDSQFYGGWGRFPVRMFKVVTQFERVPG